GVGGKSSQRLLATKSATTAVPLMSSASQAFNGWSLAQRSRTVPPNRHGEMVSSDRATPAHASLLDSSALEHWADRRHRALRPRFRRRADLLRISPGAAIRDRALDDPSQGR